MTSKKLPECDWPAQDAMFDIFSKGVSEAISIRWRKGEPVDIRRMVELAAPFIEFVADGGPLSPGEMALKRLYDLIVDAGNKFQSEFR